MTNFDRVERLLGAENLALLAAKKVGVIGLGSGGGFVALSLAMSGVGNFVLIDDDALEPTNIVRHVADRRYLGMTKVDAVADLIRQRNPQAHVETRIGRIEAHPDALDGLDLLVVGVDGEQSKYSINQAALERSLPAVYAGVYEKGEGGDVVVIHPWDGPCYACWATELREGLAANNRTDAPELDYGMIEKGGTLEAEPGLWLHVVRVAGAQAEGALNELLRGTNVYREPPANTVILANTALEIVEGQVTPPQSAVWVTIDRDPECSFCGDAVRRLRDADAEAVSMDDLLSESGIVMEDVEGE